MTLLPLSELIMADRDSVNVSSRIVGKYNCYNNYKHTNEKIIKENNKVSQLTFKTAGLFKMFTKGSSMSSFCRPKNTAVACTTTPKIVLH